MSVLLLGDSHLSRIALHPRALPRGFTSRALGGSTTADLREQRAGLDPTDFRVIAVSVGTNECGIRPVGLEEFLGLLQELLDWAGTTPVLLVNNPGADARATGQDAAQMKLYAAEGSRLVKQAGGSVLDIARVTAPLGRIGRTTDGFHINKVGHLVLVPALRLALRRAAS